METLEIKPGDELLPYIKNITVLINEDESLESVLPFFADGYPGIMFQQTSNGLYVNPQKKKMPEFFLYGQTLHPIELCMTGAYRLIIFQLFPSAVKYLLEINPADYNDSCYDMADSPAYPINPIIPALNTAELVSQQIDMISAFLRGIASAKKKKPDELIWSSINLIISSKGRLPIKEIREKLHITERTFERQFVSQVGVSPKQFAKIIQFQTSLSQLTEQDFAKLTDIVYENGFVDQSHFIRSFKQFTGSTPKQFNRKKS